MKMQTRSGVPLQHAYLSRDGEARKAGRIPLYARPASNAHAQTTWIQRELSGEGNGKRSNAQIRYLLEHGQTGIDVIGDAPTQSLLDPDHPLAREAVGTQGVSLCRKQDFLDLFDGVPFDRVSISSSVPSFFALSGLVLAAREAKFPLERLRGSILHGPLYTEDCSYAWHLPVDFRVRLALDCIEYCSRHMPKFHAYVEDTYFFSESGLAPVEEMALGFVQLRHLVRKLRARGCCSRFFCSPHRAPGQLRHGFLRRDRENPRHASPLCEDDARRVRRHESAFDVGSNHQPHFRAVADRPAAGQQHRARDSSGARAGAGRSAGA